jgi:hypothetical protein
MIIKVIGILFVIMICIALFLYWLETDDNIRNIHHLENDE